ncbi:MAG TPA: hypothetical protein VK638_28765 [Edaphobacter sp.]|nr:hypothetical protein [Edaphobacter sp.]
MSWFAKLDAFGNYKILLCEPDLGAAHLVLVDVHSSCANVRCNESNGPHRHADIALALLRVGVALNESRRFSDAVATLEQAVSELEQCAHRISEEVRFEIFQQLDRARYEIRVMN